MDTRHDRLTEAAAAETILAAGVSVSVLALRLPFTGRRLHLRLVMRRPTLGALIDIARTYLTLPPTADTLHRATRTEQMAFIAAHGKTVARMVALTMTRGWRVRPLAWLLLRRLTATELSACFMRFVCLLGTDPFLPIITSAAALNPMRPTLSHQKTKGS